MKYNKITCSNCNVSSEQWFACECHTKLGSLQEEICKHNYVAYKWKNYLDNINTGGNYIKQTGGEYTEYICLKCKEVIKLN